MRSGIVHHKSDRKSCVLPTADRNNTVEMAFAPKYTDLHFSTEMSKHIRKYQSYKGAVGETLCQNEAELKFSMEIDHQTSSTDQAGKFSLLVPWVRSGGNFRSPTWATYLWE